jgi:hypothetical protein
MMLVSKVLLLKHFLDVLDMGNKDFSYVVLPEEKVPESTVKFWKKRGYEPTVIGTAHVKFSDNRKEYLYPSYFWSE